MAINCCGRSVIIDDLLNINPESLCAPICLTVTRKNLLPVPPEGCEFALVQDIGVGSQALWQWNGVDAWESVASIVCTFLGSEIDSVNYTLSGSWRADINGEPVSGNGKVDFSPDASTVDVVFIDGDCSYVMDQIPALSPSLKITYTDPNSLPFDSTSLLDWNTYLGTDFDSFSYDATNFYFYNGTPGVALPDSIFASDTNLTLFYDYAGIFKSVGADTFNVAINADITLPAVTSVEAGGLQNVNYCGEMPGLISVGINGMNSITFIDQSDFPALETVAEAGFTNSAFVSQNLLMPSLLSVDLQGFKDAFISTVFAPLLQTVGGEGFACPLSGANNGLTIIDMPSLISADSAAFSGIRVTSADIPNCTTWGDQIFENSTLLTEVIATSLTSMGSTTGDDLCFNGITGNTIEITVPIALQTCNAGAPDGDLVYLAANNTATINYV